MRNSQHNTYIKCGEFLSICSQDIGRKQNFGYIKGHDSGTYLKKNDVTIQGRLCQNECIYKIW